MKLCECGCGKEVTKEGNRFIHGHNGSEKGENNPLYGKKLSEETKKKISEARRNQVTQPMEGKKHSEETRKKMSKAQKGRVQTEETRKKISKANKGKLLLEETIRKISEAAKDRKHSEETRMKMSEAHKGKKHPNWKGGVYKNNIALYETYAHQLVPMEEVRRIRFRELGQADFKVKCYKCKKWFIPTASQVGGRLDSLNSGGDGFHFYCSEECKLSCSIYKQNKYPKGYLPNPNRPQIDPYWRSEVIKRAKGRCERCNTKTDKLHAHHEKPATLFPMLANDIDNGWAVCEPCHYILIHGQEGCRLIDLRRIEC